MFLEHLTEDRQKMIKPCAEVGFLMVFAAQIGKNTEHGDRIT
jgi:hypothetical protein